MNEITIEKVLKVIKTLRISMGLSQSEVAKSSKMSTSFYGMIERGNRTLSVENLICIAEAFGCNITDILEMTEREN